MHQAASSQLWSSVCSDSLVTVTRCWVMKSVKLRSPGSAFLPRCSLAPVNTRHHHSPLSTSATERPEEIFRGPGKVLWRWLDNCGPKPLKTCANNWTLTLICNELILWITKRIINNIFLYSLRFRSDDKWNAYKIKKVFYALMSSFLIQSVVALQYVCRKSKSKSFCGAVLWR